jgi:hypothetical protein
MRLLGRLVRFDFLNPPPDFTWLFVVPISVRTRDGSSFATSCYRPPVVGALILTVVAVVIVIAIALCARGTIGRNPVVGIRVPAFFDSDEAWKLGHRAAVAPTIVAAFACAAVTIVAAVIPELGGTVPVFFALAFLLCGVIAGAIRGTRVIHRRGYE